MKIIARRMQHNMSSDIDFEAMLEETKPIDWHRLRFLKVMPDHFIKMELKSEIDFPDLLQWLIKNTDGRIALVDQQDNGTRFIIQNRFIGFENPAEATLFSLFF
jgi:hypothetical protein